MTPLALAEHMGLRVLVPGRAQELHGIYCCDLLSAAMIHAGSGSVWVTVMGNVNTIAVAVLREVGCVILAEGAALDADAAEQAAAHGVCVLASGQPVFETAQAAAALGV